MSLALWLGSWSAAYAASPGYAPGDQVAHLSTTWGCNVLGTQQEPGVGLDWSHLDDLPIVGSPGQSGPPPPPPRPSTANLLLGDTSDFEGGTLGDWTRSVYSGGTWINSSDQAHGGSSSMKLTCDGTGGPGIGTTPLWTSGSGYPISQGVSYRAGLWVYEPSSQPARVVSLTVEWGAPDGALLGSDHFFGNSGLGGVVADTVPGAWTFVTGDWAGTLNPSAHLCDFVLYVNPVGGGACGAGELYYFDDIAVSALAP